jgi:peptidoglycan/xylan/chitin deacetylase (PgdA/CDA1 family)
MFRKNIVYSLVAIFVGLSLGIVGVFAFVRVDGQSFAQIIGIQKPERVGRTFPALTKSDTPKNPSKTNSVDTVVIEPKPTEVQLKLPPLLPESVQKKQKFSPSSRFEKATNTELQKLVLPVLMYHHIDSGAGIPAGDKIGHNLRVGPAIFEKQLEYITEKGYTTINSDDLYAFMEFGIQLPKNPILLTFDDGYKDNIEQALPILQKHKMIGDFGIVTGVVGTGEYMTWQDHKTLLAAGNSISSHTVNHCYLAINVSPSTGTNGPFADSPVDDTPGQKCPSFTFGGQLNTGQIRGELQQSKDDLEKNLGIKIHFLIYPFGKYNAQVIKIAKEAGYSMATTVEPQADGEIHLETTPFQIHRIRMNGQQTGAIWRFLD